MQPTRIENLQLLTTHYNAFIFDLWGVVHDGYVLYPGVLDYLEHLRSLDKTILFLSNAPRPTSVTIQKLISLGIKTTPDMVLTSGDMVRDQLQHFSDDIFKTLGKRCYHLGAERNQDILAGISVDLVNKLEDADFVLLTAYMDEDEELNQYDEILKSIASLKLPSICANPDKDVINGDKMRFCAGVLAEKLEQMGGIVHYYGKPYLAIYDEAFKRFRAKNIIDKRRILMIGDTLETDILGAENAEIDSAVVLTGNMGILLAQQAENSLPSNALISDIFKQHLVNPRWVIPRFDLPN